MSDAINHAIITQVMKHLRTGNIRRCLDLGFKHEELSMLSQMSVENTTHLLNMTVPFITVNIDHDMLARSFERVLAESERQSLIQRSILYGASIHMMVTFFGIPSEEVSTRRRIMGVMVKAGRLTMPSPDASAKAWYRWKDLVKDSGLEVTDFNSMEGLDVMLLLAEETTLSLAVIWDLLKSWYPEKTRNRQKRPRKSDGR